MGSRVTFLSIFSVPRRSVLDLGSGTGQTDRQTDNGYQCIIPPEAPHLFLLVHARLFCDVNLPGLSACKRRIEFAAARPVTQQFNSRP